MTAIRFLPGTLAAGLLALSLVGCAMPDRADNARAVPVPSNVSTPAMQPDRQTDQPRSFSDPGPMYPDTGR